MLAFYIQGAVPELNATNSMLIGNSKKKRNKMLLFFILLKSKSIGLMGLTPKTLQIAYTSSYVYWYTEHK